MSRIVVFAGGGTAGHVFPALAVADALVREDPSIEPVFVGVADRLEARLVPEAGYRLELISAVAIPRRITPELARVPFGVRRGIADAHAVIKALAPLAGVTFGGYVSFPVNWALARNKIPFVIHEQNSVFGVTNKLSSRAAAKVAVSFPGAATQLRRRDTIVFTGNPVRHTLFEAPLTDQAFKASSYAQFGLSPQIPTLFVFGGSQGAHRINRALLDAYPRWAGRHMQILHATGERDFAAINDAWQSVRQPDGPPVTVVPFIRDMAAAYAIADLAVCRAGATSMAELTACAVPAILVPYPHATADHQTKNAQALVRTGGALMIDDNQLTGVSLDEAVSQVLPERARTDMMRKAAQVFGRRDAAVRVAQLVRSIATSS